MASQIDPTKPIDGLPAIKSELRANLQAAKEEIEALQNGKLAPPVTNADLAEMVQGTIKGRTSAGTGAPEDLTPAQTRIVLALGALALQDQVLVPDGLGASDTPDATTFLRGDGRWSTVPSGTVPEPRIVTITGTAHTLAKAEATYQNVALLEDNGNQDCAITMPDTDTTSPAGVVWAILSKTTGTVTVQREVNGTVNSGHSVQMVGFGRSGMLLVESNPGTSPAARFEGDTTETVVLDGDIDAAGKQIKNALGPLADSEVTADRDLAPVDAQQKMLRVNASGAVTLTVREGTAVDFQIGAVVNILRWGSGGVNIAAGTGVTINKPSDRSLSVRARYEVVSLWKQGPDTWLAFGGLAST